MDAMASHGLMSHLSQSAAVMTALLSAGMGCNGSIGHVGYGPGVVAAVRVQIPLLDDECDVQNAEATVTADDIGVLGPYSLDVNGNEISGTIEDIPVGAARKITVTALNARLEPVYGGSTTVNISASHTSTASVVLYRHTAHCPPDATGDVEVIGTVSNDPMPSADGATLLRAGMVAIVDLFISEDTVFVVDEAGVTAVDLAGQQIASWVSPRDVTSAAFDGTYLIVADRAIMTTLDKELLEVASAALQETCVSSVILSGHRFVCGPGDDSPRVFYTYAAQTGELIGTSTEDIYSDAITMRRVPGTDDFICTRPDTSYELQLYRLGANHRVLHVGDSRYYGDLEFSSTYAFFGEPATHVITHEGSMLKVYGSSCDVGENDYPSTCFVKDGVLGNLSDGEVMPAMVNDDSGHVYAVVRNDEHRWSHESLCEEGCAVQRIDVAGRLIVAEAWYTMAVRDFVRLRAHQSTGSVIVGYDLPSYEAGNDVGGYAGYHVVALLY